MANEIAPQQNIQQGEIILYQPDETVRLERQRVGGLCPGMVRLEDDTVWLTQAQIVALFQKAKSTISFHISNIFKEGELDEKVVVRKNRTTTMHGAINGKIQTHEVAFYNRNMKKIMIMDKYRLATILVAVLIVGSTAKAQTTIGGSVYGGGALANTGNTQVNLTGGTI